MTDADADADTDVEQAIRIAYDIVAVDYERLLRDHLADADADKQALARFADRVLAEPPGRVADLGCGPGRIIGHLHDLGLDVFGIDLSPAMIAVARERHPSLRFEVGSMTALDLPDGELAAAVAWYSVIHTAPAGHPALFAELHRVLRPEGRLLLAFQVGDEAVHLEHAYGHDIALDVHRLDPDRVVTDLERTGFIDVHCHVRDAVGELERHPQAYVSARTDPPG